MMELEHAIRHIKTRADAWAVKEVTEALQSISDRLDKALSQEPCDDAISREDAVYALRKALWDYEDKTEKQFRERDDLDYEEWYFHRIFVQAMNDEDVETICKLPSVTQKSGHFIDGVHAIGYREGYKDAQKQKSGKWIDHSDEGYVECPFCDHATNCEDNIDELHYCFYCVAKMESEDKE